MVCVEVLVITITRLERKGTVYLLPSVKLPERVIAINIFPSGSRSTCKRREREKLSNVLWK